MIPNLDVLGSVVRDIHASLSGLFYVAMPVAIIFSVVVGYLQNGAPNYIDILRRAIIASLLLVAFPEISNLILDLCDGLAGKIDNLSGIENFMRMAQEKSQSYAGAKAALLLKFDDLIIAFLSFISFVILYIARYLSVALYYFYWILLSALSPLLILFYMFPATAGITKNLFRGLIEVAAWKIVWAVQSAMLTALSLGNIYKTEGAYLTIIVLNFVIAIGMLYTPSIVKSLVGNGIQSTAQSFASIAATAMAATPARAALISTKVRSVLDAARGQSSKTTQDFKKHISRR